MASKQASSPNQIDALATLARLVFDQDGAPLRQAVAEALPILAIVVRALLSIQANRVLGLSAIEAVALSLLLALAPPALPCVLRWAARFDKRATRP
ncbi:MAG TPA: hypothetical protein VGV37_28875 [Aliidongia sp.]|uniref:hypothetical protein n=1 Tax=Aliidongia sp. TaxID=1914230 RepID=UPI002DDCAD72|nr:hypothetical protein [Aliidongia sp.]HEV2678575.1 hypothetical protein [Aliidongia sp.]